MNYWDTSFVDLLLALSVMVINLCIWLHTKLYSISKANLKRIEDRLELLEKQQ